MISKNVNLLRFIVLYVLAYSFPFPIGSISGTKTIVEKVVHVTDGIILWVGHNIFQITDEIHLFYSGSGDTYWHFIRLVLVLTFALVGTVFWAISNKSILKIEALNFWFLVYLQLYLASGMFQYGVVKVTMSQFTELSFQMLIEPYGNSSPMELAWAFFGFSKAQNLFVGSIEIACGFLFLFRKTRLLAALIGAVILSNVVVFNLTFDIPVKLYAIHILFFMLLVIAPDFKRLLSVILRKEQVAELEENENLENRKWIQIRRYVVWLLAVLLTIEMVYKANMLRSEWGDYTPDPPLYGLYEIECFVINSDTLQPILTDTIRWRYIGMDKPNTFDIYSMDLAQNRFTCQVDTTKRMIEFGSASTSESKNTLRYLKTDSTFEFTTIYKSDSIFGKAKIWKKSDFPLLQRRFHWHTEFPFKR